MTMILHLVWWVVAIVGFILFVAPGIAAYINAKRKWR